MKNAAGNYFTFDLTRQIELGLLSKQMFRPILESSSQILIKNLDKIRQCLIRLMTLIAP